MNWALLNMKYCSSFETYKTVTQPVVQLRSRRFWEACGNILMISQQGLDLGSQTLDPMLLLSSQCSQNCVPTEEPPAWHTAMSRLAEVCKQLKATAKLQIRKLKLECKTLQTFQRGQRQCGQEGAPSHLPHQHQGWLVASPWSEHTVVQVAIPLTG